MKKTITLFLMVFSMIQLSNAQTTAMDFTMDDCNGQMHNLFSELDQNNVIILEFFMNNCGSCINAGNKLEVMHNQLASEFPGHVLFYHFGYTNSYNCTTVKNWVTANGYNSVPFDSGAAQVAYYGGMGMPTIAIVGGTQHDVLYTGVGFTTSDTVQMAAAVRNHFAQNPLAVNEIPVEVSSLSLFPNPANENFSLQLNLKKTSNISLQLFDITGKKMEEIYSGKAIGIFQKNISTSSLVPGIYLVKATINGNPVVRKISVAK